MFFNCFFWIGQPCAWHGILKILTFCFLGRWKRRNQISCASQRISLTDRQIFIALVSCHPDFRAIKYLFVSCEWKTDLIALGLLSQDVNNTQDITALSNSRFLSHSANAVFRNQKERQEFAPINYFLAGNLCLINPPLQFLTLVQVNVP